MLKTCVKAWEKVVQNAGKVFVFYTPSTVYLKYLTSQAFFKHNLLAAFKQTRPIYRHPKLPLFNLLINYLYPLYTTPMTNTSLIKD